MPYKLAPMTPLKGSFMLASILGFLVSVFYIYPKSNSFGFAFALVFLIMFIASMLSMTFSDTGGELQIDTKRVTAIKGPEKKAAKKRPVKKKKGRKRRR